MTVDRPAATFRPAVLRAEVVRFVVAVDVLVRASRRAAAEAAAVRVGASFAVDAVDAGRREAVRTGAWVAVVAFRTAGRAAVVAFPAAVLAFRAAAVVFAAAARAAVVFRTAAGAFVAVLSRAVEVDLDAVRPAAPVAAAAVPAVRRAAAPAVVLAAPVAFPAVVEAVRFAGATFRPVSAARPVTAETVRFAAVVLFVAAPVAVRFVAAAVFFAGPAFVAALVIFAGPAFFAALVFFAGLVAVRFAAVVFRGGPRPVTLVRVALATVPAGAWRATGPVRRAVVARVAVTPPAVPERAAVVDFRTGVVLLAPVFRSAAAVFFAVVRAVAGRVVALRASAISSPSSGTCTREAPSGARSSSTRGVPRRSSALPGPAGVLGLPRLVPFLHPLQGALGFGGRRIRTEHELGRALVGPGLDPMVPQAPVVASVSAVTHDITVHPGATGRHRIMPSRRCHPQ
ncbi:hypothetical protein ACIBJE_07250 [Micromonospora sp. NPDC050187]|uniref:hypothetical protein n=1 Tax=Micromonospora sp. NPDC050187 TaxID=3364277 RepID=UPI0037A46BAB